ncbi:hypothetical protein [Amycolatopsis sp.]|uniref:hypothetical protein n=1 Tax=Amycolatopsis sp. TaxID=37632 RepID=UPI002CA1B5CE|nr:hypothetical protein [Amycolatopsis sp.]HVV11636.1 hypothetical protein [Amycolatopsis sp.]
METATKHLPRKSWLMRVGIGVFALGVLAVLVVFVMFAAGLRDLPVWLSAAAGVATPLGIALGLIALVREHRRS